MDATPVLRFAIEGQEVLCYQANGDRLWHCSCIYFQKMLAKHHQGFCPHIAIAIQEATSEGRIQSRP